MQSRAAQAAGTHPPPNLSAQPTSSLPQSSLRWATVLLPFTLYPYCIKVRFSESTLELRKHNAAKPRLAKGLCHGGDSVGSGQPRLPLHSKGFYQPRPHLGRPSCALIDQNGRQRGPGPSSTAIGLARQSYLRWARKKLFLIDRETDSQSQIQAALEPLARRASPTALLAFSPPPPSLDH